MRILCIAVSLLFAAQSHAQLSPKNAAGVTYGHTHLSVANLAEHKKVFIDVFGGELLQRGTRTLVKYPNMIIVFYERQPSGPSQGTVMDHFGFKVRSLAVTTQALQKMGIEAQQPFKGAEGFQNAYFVTGDGVRIEMQEDSTLTVPAMPNHVHFITPDYEKLLDWYVDTFSLDKRNRGTIKTTADAGTVNLTFANAKTPTLPTKSRAIDHIGFEVQDLDAFTKQLQAKGIKLDVPVSVIKDTGLKYAFITDPSGTYIELTEGLVKY